MNCKNILFLSDVHLDPKRSQDCLFFCDFLSAYANYCSEIYILGDLFAYWIGDAVNNIFITKIKEVLKTAAQISKVYFMPGNRDFLIGKNFLEALGVNLLKDPCIRKICNNNVFLTHGDMFCKSDVSHQIYRKIAYRRFVKFLFLSLPLNIRYKIASFMQRSDFISKNIDITDKCIKKILKCNDIQYMIHGHTHIPQVCEYHYSSVTQTRITLGAWEDNAEVCIASGNGFSLVPAHKLV